MSYFFLFERCFGFFKVGLSRFQKNRTGPKPITWYFVFSKVPETSKNNVIYSIALGRKATCGYLPRFLVLGAQNTAVQVLKARFVYPIPLQPFLWEIGARFPGRGNGTGHRCPVKWPKTRLWKTGPLGYGPLCLPLLHGRCHRPMPDRPKSKIQAGRLDFGISVGFWILDFGFWSLEFAPRFGF